MTATTRPDRAQRGGRTRMLAWSITIITLLVVLAIVTWLFIRPLEAEHEDFESALPSGEGLTIERIVVNPDAYIGQFAIVNGEVERPLGLNAFVINPLGDQGEVDLLVLSERPLPAVADWPARRSLAEGDIAAVAGFVRRFELLTLEQEFGYDLDDQLAQEWQNKPVLIVRQLSLTPAAAVPASPPAITNEGLPVEVAPLALGDMAAVGSIAENPVAYAGRLVTVTGRIGQELAPGVSAISSGGFFGLLDEQVMVVSVRPDALEVGERVRMTGLVTLFDLPTFERQLGLDLDDEAFAGQIGEPVIVALASYPVVTISELVDNASAYADQIVSTTGAVADVISLDAFTIEPDALFGEDEILVLGAGRFTPLLDGLPPVGGEPGAGDAAPDLGIDDAILIIGIVRPFDIAAFERELGLDLDDARLADWAGKPAIQVIAVRRNTGQSFGL